MSNPGDFGQNQGGAPQWGAPQQGFDPNQTQGYGQGFQQPQQQPYGQPQQQWGAQPQAAKKPLPYTIREFILLGVGVVILILSFFSIAPAGGPSVWGMGFWIPLVILPLIATALIGLRPFLPLAKRFGSLSADQFASVAYSVALITWISFGLMLSAISGLFGGYGGGVSLSAFVWILIILTIGGVVLTVGAPFIPGLREEFDQRPEEVATRAARTTRVIPEGRGVAFAVNTPANNFGAPQQTGAYDTSGWNTQNWNNAPQQAAPADNSGWGAPAPVPAPDGSAQANGWAAPAAEVPAAEVPAAEAPVEEAPAAEAPAAEAPVAQQPFWALVPEERAVVDESGAELFRVGPTAWALVVEDKGSSFVIRHEDGRTGTLNDVSGVTRN